MSDREHIGSIIGLSTPFEFTMAVKPGGVNLYDFVALDVQESGSEDVKRCWAKVIKLERFNPLLPKEAGHEIASMGIEAIDTVVSLSREFVTAQAQILGLEKNGDVEPLIYPVKPASSVYIPPDDDVQRLLIGETPEHRGLEIGKLRSRDIDILIDGHFLVSRHLAIFAMTGAGKSWTCRTILEKLIEKKYPILIFDPHGDYIGMKNVEKYGDNVDIFLPIIHFEAWPADEIRSLVENICGQEFSDAQLPVFTDSYKFIVENESDYKQFIDNYREEYGEKIYGKNKAGFYNIWSLINFLEAVFNIKNDGNEDTFEDILPGSVLKAGRPSITATIRKCKRMGVEYNRVTSFNKQIPRLYGVEPLILPQDLTELVKKGKVSIISLSGYSDSIQSAIMNQVLNSLLQAKIENKIKLPFLNVIEEAHNFAPSSSEGIGEVSASLSILKTVATEGRKFGMGLILISQRPSRLHPTVSSQCNSFIILRLINPADQRYIREIVETMAETDVALLKELSIGEALITGQITRFPVLAKIYPPISKGMREEQDRIQEVIDYK